MARRDTPPQTARSLGLRVALGVLSLLLVGGIVVAIASFAYGRQAARTAYDRLLLGAANDIAETISIENGVPVADLPVSAFQLLALARDDRIGYALRDQAGALLTGHDSVQPAPASDRPGPSPVFFDGRLQEAPARFVTLTRRFAERDYSGAVTVTVGQTLLARNEMALGLTRNALIVTGLGGLALMALALAVIRHALRPLDRVAAELLARDPYDLTPMEAPVPAEVGVMLGAMNRFMRRLDRQIGSMRNLISDTAHQLRTPVAALRVQAELAAEEPDPGKQRQMLDRLARRSRSLGELLDQMLSRALVIHRTDSAPRLPVDLRDIALAVFESQDHELLAPGTETGLEIGPDPVLVLADEMSLTEAARNMFNNALRHGRAPVRIGVGAAPGQAVLWVEDAGEGPPPEVLARAGERFTRSAAARGQSAGLGLSILHAVAEAFEGEVRQDRHAAGFRIALILPPLPPPPEEPR
jgi:two-component system sensor histidine kinase TctE